MGSTLVWGPSVVGWDFLCESPVDVVIDEIALEGVPTDRQTNLVGVGYFPHPITLEPPKQIVGSLP